MPVRSDVLWSVTIVGDDTERIECPAGERWIVKWWTLWADDNVTDPGSRVYLRIEPESSGGVGVLLDTDAPPSVHETFTNARADNLAPALFVVLVPGDDLVLVREGGDGFFHLNVWGARLALTSF